MARKHSSSLSSSYASVYLITAFFAVSLFSLIYLTHPQEYISHFDYLRIIKLDTTTIPLLNNDFLTPSVNVLREAFLVNPVTTPPPPVVEISATVVEEERRMAVNQTAGKQEHQEEEEEDEDETIIASVDHLSFPSNITTKEERMKWMKQKLPESTVLESTTKTRKFEQKIQQFISTKKCSVSIFMTWISPTKFFGKRELFSLESVVKAHPHGCVIIISKIMASKEGRKIIQPLLERGHNILSVAPDFPLLFSGTPAQDWLERLKNGKLDPGTIPITQNLSNLLRLVILYKYGGVYFDTDMIILKDVSGLRNSIGIQEGDETKNTWRSVNNAVLIFDKNHPILLRFLEEFNSTFDGNVWGQNGPHLATRIIKKFVDDTRYQFNVMSPMAFYPVTWYRIFKFFKDPKGADWANDMFNKVSKETYGVHLWNKVSRSLEIEKGSIIGRLISEHCIICQDVYDS